MRTVALMYNQCMLASKGVPTPQVCRESRRGFFVAADLPQMVRRRPFRSLQPPTVPTRHNIIAVLSASTEVFGTRASTLVSARLCVDIRNTRETLKIVHVCETNFVVSLS